MIQPARGALLVLVLSLGCGRPTAQGTATAAVDLSRAAWTVEEVGVGVTWRALHQDDLFGAPQSLNVLELELPRNARRLRFAAPEPFGRVPTSRLARLNGALAAVNGGFFDTKDGMPLGLFRTDGKTRVEPDAGRSATLGIDRRERVSIADRGRDDWSDVEHARGSWPLILHRSKPVKPRGWGPKDRRHPRTAAGLTEAGNLVLLTVDGRTDDAAGMTLLELAYTMRALGCETAMNLDGGGSTTMWIRGRGVVSFPCDNQRYDHGGERAVADAVLVLAPAILRFDEDRATLSPAGGWTLEQDERCVGGDYARTSAADGAMRFEIQLAAAGDYHLELRWPRAPGTAGGLTCAIDDREPPEVAAGRAPNRWVRLGTLALTVEPMVVVVRSANGEPFALDALQLVEVPAEGR